MASRHQKEALYIQVPTPDGAVEFNDATAHLGRKSPFKKPKMICGMAVGSGAVSFSLLMLTKKSATAYANKDLDIPRAALHRLSRYAAENPVQEWEALIEYEGGTQRARIVVGDGGVTELEPLEDELPMELPRGAARLTLIIKTPKLDRPISIGFVGYPGKPGTPSTARRIASMALYNLSLLAPFRMLTGIETVSIPAAPGAVYQTRSSIGEASAEIPVWLFAEGVDGKPEPRAAGSIVASVDLDQANPTTGKPVVHVTPDDSLAEHFEEYREVVGKTLSDLLTTAIGEDEMREIIVSIVLGDVARGHVEMMKEALEGFSKGFDFTPKFYQTHS